MERDIKLVPHITEKALKNQDINQYIFEVSKKSTKPEIKKLIEKKYNVKVKNIRIINLPPKTKRFQRKESKVSAVKKAVLTLQKGYKIDFEV